MAVHYSIGLGGSLWWHDSFVSTDVASLSWSEPGSEALIFVVRSISNGNWRCLRHRLGES